MMLIKIAWRNIWRSKLRSAVVMFAIASGLVGGLFSSAWMNGMANQRVKDTFSIETAHIQFHNPEFADNFDVKKRILSTQEKLEELKKIDGIKAVTSRLKISAMAATANKNMGVTIVGINPKTEKEVFGLYKKIDTIDGDFFDTKKKNAIVISKALAKELKAKLKSKIVLTFQDYNGEITGAAFKVVGIFKTTNSVWDKMHVFVKATDLRSVLELPKDQFHEIDILLNDYNQATIISEQLQKKYPDILSEDWSEIQPYINFITKYMDVMMGVFMLIILGALGFGIVNTMLMVILERTRELGMLMAIGMTKKRVFIMIMLETIFLALVGALIGELISMLLINYYGKVGINLSSMAEGLETIGYSAITYPELDSVKYVQITIMVFVTGVLASIYPAIKALKLDPASAIRTI
ncbi:MAG: FtsX-like permease family protein [Flavobacteriaceae bacterium]|nr:FtsX-like permease family protein [Flavobacteriaceae bacterium]